ncbi:hypothetical protein CHISP_3000 [Chitinispirillum alkaliphilum]|nr:hypothetical protein CHISP_3000 [Chitinispirillum alkaliphilum]
MSAEPAQNLQKYAVFLRLYAAEYIKRTMYIRLSSNPGVIR